MSAVVYPGNSPRRYGVWCEDCGDGINASKNKCEAWAAAHNEKEHKA